VVFEVVSTSSGRRDYVTKLRKYQAVASISWHVIAGSNDGTITLLSRKAAGEDFLATGLSRGKILELHEIGIEIPIDAIYESATPAEHHGVTLAAWHLSGAHVPANPA